MDKGVLHGHGRYGLLNTLLPVPGALETLER